MKIVKGHYNNVPYAARIILFIVDVKTKSVGVVKKEKNVLITHLQRISFNMDPVFLMLLRASLCVQSSQLALLIDLTSNPSAIPALSALLLGVT